MTALATVLPALVILLQEPPESPPPEQASDVWTQSRLTGNWGGLRDRWKEHGVTIDLDATYVFQGVVSGGLRGPLFDAFSDETDVGNTVSAVLGLEVDTGKAGLWEGGYFAAQLEGRAGRSVLQRAGSVSAVNNDALFPNVTDGFDQEVIAVTEVSFTQYFGDAFALYGGLLNTAAGDQNPIAGWALSNDYFLNSALLYSLVEDATTPNVSLGGGMLFEPSESISGSISVYGTSETAGEDPFDHTTGTTFSTEWTVGHVLFERPGEQTFGFLYGIDASRTNIALDPRLVLGAVLQGQPIPTTDSDTWALYYNAAQFIEGDAEHGWGAFLRLGLSDGDPNPVRWNLAAGAGGTGLFPGREDDRWGLGFFYLGMSDADLLSGLGVGDESGAELFYNFALAPWFGVTLDAQVVDGAIPGGDTAWVLGMRTTLSF